MDNVLSVPDDIQTVTTSIIEISKPFPLSVQAHIIEPYIEYFNHILNHDND